VPIFTEFMEVALEKDPATPFRIPPGVRLVKVDARTGEPSPGGGPGVIDEAFRPGTEPGMNVFTGQEDCLSISGSCGDGTQTAGTMPDGTDPGDTADETLDGIF
jgi:penicillin-binding protein 1A